jgi:peptidoglycan/xylan/chitin deacetylase (PgdA/CDA1 family)
MSLLRQATKRILTTFIPTRWLLTRGPIQASHAKPRLALTFDDGPHPSHTPRLLDVLNANGLVATFFVVGQEAKRYPDLIHRMVAEGHELANHTWSHGDPSRTSTRRFLDEVRDTNELLRELTGILPMAMRPPRGELNATKLWGLWNRGLTVALWNVDPRDYRLTNEDDAAAWTIQYEPRDGDVVLMHDNHPWAVGMIETMISRGLFDRFQAVTISALAGRRTPAVVPRSPALASSP